VQPSHIIILGLVIALAGIIWQMLVSNALDQKVAQPNIASKSPMVAPVSPPSPVSQPLPPRPYYEPEDISQILTALREMRGIIDKMPTSEETEALRWNWSKTLKRDGGAAEMAAKLKDIGVRVLAGMNALGKLTEVDHKHYSAELHPVAFLPVEQQYVGAFSGASSQLASELNDLARAQDIDVEKWTQPTFNE
jgi:hypothetical protein